MPPIVKYSKEKIIDAAIEIIRDEGLESVSARNIAKRLGCSICPVFSCFENMESLKKEAGEKLLSMYNLYIEEGSKSIDKPFKKMGLNYINFAKENKNFFKAIFMNKTNSLSLEELLNMNDYNEKILEVIMKSSGFNYYKAKKLQKYTWLFVHSIAVMIATEYCYFSDEEISEMLSEEYEAMLEKIGREEK